MRVGVAPDLELWAEVTGRGSPVLLLHGFTGSGREWDGVVGALGAGVRAVAVDLVGHGRSGAPTDPARYAPERAARDLRALLDALGVARAHVVGYSLGGRVALRLALDAPERVAGLVLVSATAGIEDDGARAARRAQDLALAERIEREGVERFVDEWASAELFAAERALPDERRAATRRVRLAQRPAGLAGSLRGMGQGAWPPLWARLGGIRAPTIIVTGERDARYTAAGARIASLVAGARHVVVPGGGHAAHRERPAEVAAIVARLVRGDAPAADRRVMEALT